MSQPKGSIGVAVAVAVLIVIAVTSLGYYQFVYCSPSTCSTSTTSTTVATCAPPACITIQMLTGAASLTTTAFAPDSAKLVIGVNNTFQVYNNDSQSGGVSHTLTADDCKTTTTACTFDTGIMAYGAYSKIFTITTPGTYAYYCQIHPTTMVGTITVVAGNNGRTVPPPNPSTTTASASTSTSSGAPSSSAATQGVSVSIPSGSGLPAGAPGYAPDKITVVLGVNSTVTWTNNDSVPHTVTSLNMTGGSPVFDSGPMSAGATFTFNFSQPGTYLYKCNFHAWMTGTVVVKSA